MSNSIDINRFFNKKRGGWIADLRISINGVYIYFSEAKKKTYKTETAAIRKLIRRLESLFPIIPDLKERVKEKYKELIETGWDGGEDAFKEDMEEVLTFSSKQADQLTHVSCRFHNEKNYGLRVTRANSERWGLPQFDLKHRIQDLAEGSREFKLFNENTCFMCTKTFKEILDDNQHLVRTCCSHVFCCSCLDRILKKTTKEDSARCPLCENKFDPYAFELIWFNVDLTVNEECMGEIFIDHTGYSDRK